MIARMRTGISQGTQLLLGTFLIDEGNQRSKLNSSDGRSSFEGTGSKIECPWWIALGRILSLAIYKLNF